MDLGSGIVDALRIGEGTAEGSLGGVDQDVLRLLVFLGPLGRAGGIASKVLSPWRMRLAVQVRGVDGPCTFQAVNNALSILKGRNLFVTIEDMATAMGKPIQALTKNKQGLYELGAWIDELVPVLNQLPKLKIREISGLSNIGQVVDLAKQGRGVVVFAFKASVQAANGKVESILHTVIAVRKVGRVRFGDYGGKLVDSLDELIRNLGDFKLVSPPELYQFTSSATILQTEGVLGGQTSAKLARGAVLLINGLTAIETTENGVELALPVSMIEIDTRSSHRVYRDDRQPGPLGANLTILD
jgi:hypothetical protein